MAEETNKNDKAEKTETKPRAVKVGDTVGVCCYSGKKGARFERCRREAIVDKVHHKGAFVDLTIPHESGDPTLAIKITNSPRDDRREKPDSWHFAE